ncbi:unnamed protein product [Brassica oleracea var. botrytis]|uniref:60S ribosomal protein L41 n=3 Tax=Brassica TaxID=3705 RepID=A0A816JTL0_BRANA|nr:unnamed protein product [Brassica napus]
MPMSASTLGFSGVYIPSYASLSLLATVTGEYSRWKKKRMRRLKRKRRKMRQRSK